VPIAGLGPCQPSDSVSRTAHAAGAAHREQAPGLMRYPMAFPQSPEPPAQVGGLQPESVADRDEGEHPLGILGGEPLLDMGQQGHTPAVVRECVALVRPDRLFEYGEKQPVLP
jgi:hypothetical protein